MLLRSSNPKHGDIDNHFFHPDPEKIEVSSKIVPKLRRIAHAAFTPLEGFEEFLQVLRSRHGLDPNQVSCGSAGGKVVPKFWSP